MREARGPKSSSLLRTAPAHARRAEPSVRTAVPNRQVRRPPYAALDPCPHITGVDLVATSDSSARCSRRARGNAERDGIDGGGPVGAALACRPAPTHPTDPCWINRGSSPRRGLLMKPHTLDDAGREYHSAGRSAAGRWPPAAGRRPLATSCTDGAATGDAGHTDQRDHYTVLLTG